MPADRIAVSSMPFPSRGIGAVTWGVRTIPCLWASVLTSSRGA